VSLFRRAWSAFGRLGTIIAIALAFIFGMTGTVYLSLRSPEVKVPNILGKDRQAAEDELTRAGLNMRVRATRYSSEVKPDSVLLQLPHPDEVVKTGQTVAVDISRAQAKEGEVSTSVANQNEEKKQESEENKEDGNQNESQPGAANNQNANQNQNNRNKNKNKNANNSNNRNANNANNRNGNANANRPAVNANNRNAPVTANNSNRTGNNTNTNRRPPVTTPPFNPGSNTRP
jgi:beta-lactam-binding protein with PASTA domain